MKKFINLLNFEMDRFLKFLLPTLLITGLLQFYQVFQAAQSYKNDADNILAQSPEGTKAVISELGYFSMRNVTSGGIFTLSLGVLVLVFVFYSFFIWYRDWLGRNTFAYRLLMLPIHRIQILLTKAAVFIIGGLLAFSVQFGMFFIEEIFAKQLIPNGLFMELNMHDIQPMYDLFFDFIFPKSGVQFLSVYSFAFAALITLFTGIIFERSFGIKGLITGVLYFAGYFVLYLFINGIAYYDFVPFILKPSQVFISLLIYQFIVILLGILLSNFLLKKKIKI